MKKFCIISAVSLFLASSVMAQEIDLSIRSYPASENQNNVSDP